MVQALPTGEIKVCHGNNYTQPSSTKGYIYTIGVKNNDEVKKRQRNIHSFQKRQRLKLISLQTIKMKIKRKDINPMRS